MKTFKYDTNLEKIDIDNPAFPIINEFIHRLIITANTKQYPYNPENDGYIVLVEADDVDRALIEIWPDGDWGLLDIPWEGITKDETGQFFIATYLANNQFGLVFVIPDKYWLKGELREVIESHLDE